MSNVVDLEPAKGLKRLGAPYNAPIENREFTRKGSERYLPIWNAGTRFWVCVLQHGEKPTTQSLRRLKKALANIVRAAERLDSYLPELPPDDMESVIFASFLTEKVVPFVNQWHSIIATIEDGEEVQLLGPASKDDIWVLQTDAA